MPKNLKIIALDLGRNFAWASNRLSPKHYGLRVGCQVYDGLRAHRLGLLLLFLQTTLDTETSAGRVDAIVYETPFARGRDATRSLWGIAGIIEACATNAGLPVVDVAVPTIKKFATGDGRGSKEAMTAAAKKFGYKGSNEHEADAVCLLKYAEANLERVL